MDDPRGPRHPGAGSRLRVAWLTNLPAPYRLPVWRQLARSCELTVWLLARQASNRRWRAPVAPEPFGLVGLPSLRLQRGETAVYAVWPQQAWSVAGCDVVVLCGWESPAAWQVLAAARARGAATVAFYESTRQSVRHAGGLIGQARRAFFRSVHAVLVTGPAAYEAVRALGVEPGRIVQTVNPVDVASIHRSAAAARREAGRTGAAPPGGHVFVFVGQLIPRKRPALLLAAFARVREPGDRLLVVGEGPLEAELRALAQDLGLGPSVQFLGYRDPEALPAVLAGAHSLVLCSEREVWGLVVNEGLAAGLHVVTTLLAGVTRAVQRMPGVFVFDGAAAGLGQAMRASRAAWSGPIENPEILAFTPERMAHEALDAIGLALLSRRFCAARPSRHPLPSAAAPPCAEARRPPV
jgi:glycosyltransferase involved in cell wall biosynthesis